MARCGFPKRVEVALRKRTYNHQRRQPNLGLNLMGAADRMN
jgi:hypothetical protein